FVLGGRDETGGRGVNPLQVLVADALQPEQPAPRLGNGGKLSRQRFDVPSLLADDDEIHVDISGPQALECAQYLVVALARLDGTHSHEGRTRRQYVEHFLRISRKTT